MFSLLVGVKYSTSLLSKQKSLLEMDTRSARRRNCRNGRLGSDRTVKSDLIYAETFTNFPKTNCKIEISITIDC